jgi:hypothetical protein
LDLVEAGKDVLAQAEAEREAPRREKEAQLQRELEQARKLAEESDTRRAAEEARARDAEAAAKAQRKSSTRLRRLVLGLALVLIIALLAAWLAYRQGQIAQARSLITQSQLQIRNQHLNLATLLALEAQKYEPDYLAGTLWHHSSLTLTTSSLASTCPFTGMP